jgi:ubiquinone/menaquinone biosynthesis C-methylase UbiE
MPVSGGAQFIKPQQILEKMQLIEDMKVADLGCGNLGYFVIPVAKVIGKKGIAYVVDIRKSVLETVKSRAKLEVLTNLEYVWADLEKIGSTKIPEGSLDVDFLINVLFQNKKHGDILKEAARLLKKGGKLMVVDWKKVGVPFGPPVEVRVDPETIKSLAAKLNLQLVEQTDIGDYFWGLIFVKI